LTVSETCWRDSQEADGTPHYGTEHRPDLRHRAEASYIPMPLIKEKFESLWCATNGPQRVRRILMVWRALASAYAGVVHHDILPNIMLEGKAPRAGDGPGLRGNGRRGRQLADLERLSWDPDHEPEQASGIAPTLTDQYSLPSSAITC
jgi:hypothetical protein